MSQAPFLAKKLNHESNPFKNDVFIKFKCFRQKKKKKRNVTVMECYGMLRLLPVFTFAFFSIPKRYSEELCIAPT